jgi:hypothetical protein
MLNFMVDWLLKRMQTKLCKVDGGFTFGMIEEQSIKVMGYGTSMDNEYQKHLASVLRHCISYCPLHKNYHNFVRLGIWYPNSMITMWELI